MTDDDLNQVRQWIGSSEQEVGIVTAELVSRMKATIHEIALPAGFVPLGLHWCLALNAISGALLGTDGHPRKGSFLPPIPLPNRMWASGEIEFHDNLRVGDVVERLSEIADINLKNGRSGPLCFVTVAHRWSTERGLAISELQHIVYRNAAAAEKQTASPLPALFAAGQPSPDAVSLLPDPAMLFRYSALTFNAHRIHYDRDYAVDEEGYPERVVHGPLQATLLMNLVAASAGIPRSFSFRAVRPAFVNARLWLTSEQSASGICLRTVNDLQETCLEASAVWVTADGKEASS